MEGSNNIACPVCTLYLRPGMSLESHLTSHPKQKVIEALIRVTQTSPQNIDKVENNECSQQTSGMSIFPPVNINANLNQIPTNHSFIYQQFMSSSGTQPMLNVNPVNQQFVAVPAVFNPQMVCSPYIFQQQQQVQIVSAAANIQPFIPRSQDVFPSSSSPAICAVTDTELQDPLSTNNIVPNSPTKCNIISVNSSPFSNKSFKNESVREINREIIREINREKLLNSTNLNNSNSIPENLEKEEEQIEDKSNQSNEPEEINDEVISLNIDVDHNAVIEIDVDKDVEEKKDKDELNKACQTTQTVIDKDIHNEISNSEHASNVGKIVLIASEHEIFDDSQTVHFTSHNDYEVVQECTSENGLQNNDTVAVLEMDDMNFILPNDFIQNGHSIISKVSQFECLSESNRNDRAQVLMNIGEDTLTSADIVVNVSEEKCIVGTPDYEEDKFVNEKIDEESISRESLNLGLNIRADEKMPPRGELSEQESNGASELGWGSRIYQEGSSGMSTSYDLLARESWEASDCSDSEMPPLQSRIQPPIDYSPEDVDEPEEIDEQTDSKSASTFDFNCSTCGQTFRCPKERRVHQAKEHATSSSNAAKKILKKRLVNMNLGQDKVDNKLEVFVKSEDLKLELSDGEDEIAEPKNEEIDLGITTEENLLCNTCGELLPSMKDLTLHNKKIHNIHLPNLNLTCKTCNESFRKKREFTEHLKEHPLECNICGKQFFKPPNLKMHLRRHAGIRPHKCELCSKAFFAKQKLREHMNIHAGISPIKCTLCDESFRRYSNLVQHRNYHHLKIKRKTRDYICHCGEVCQSKSKLNWHKETHEPKPKSCKYCNEKFIHMASLTRHIRRTHNQRYVPNDRDDENVECKICKGVYLKTSLEAHLYTHSGKKQHTCPICNKEFTTKWNLKLHKWTHAAPTTKPYRCETCNSAFVRESDYTSHMNSHRSIRPYTCNYCGCKFIRKYNCVRHVREHEEGKSYNCDVCNKSFHRSYYLKEHMRVHTGVRPFSCHICGKTSTTKSNHNKHMKIHHAREPVMTEG